MPRPDILQQATRAPYSLAFKVSLTGNILDKTVVGDGDVVPFHGTLLHDFVVGGGSINSGDKDKPLAHAPVNGEAQVPSGSGLSKIVLMPRGTRRKG